MTNLEEAREQALREVEHWRTENRFLRQSLGEVEAARAEDEQRIAALVDKVTMTAEAMEEEADARADGDSELVLRTFANMLRRALAGQTENAE